MIENEVAKCFFFNQTSNLFIGEKARTDECPGNDARIDRSETENYVKKAHSRK